MWLKKKLPRHMGEYRSSDLADFMTWKSTGSLARSRCTLTSKRNYLAHLKDGWRKDFLEQIGLEDLQARGRLPDDTIAVGGSVGTLTKEAARAKGRPRTVTFPPA